jgi:hypothetical protein
MFDLEGLINDCDTVEELTVFRGTEDVQVRIVGVRTGVDKNSKPYFMPQFEIVKETGYKEFSKFYHVPDTDAMDRKKYESCIRQLRTFATAFDIDIRSMFDGEGVIKEDNLIGQQAWVQLGVDDDEKYGEQNYIAKFM